MLGLIGAAVDRCDEAGECDGPETAMAIGAPLAAAALALLAVRRRRRAPWTRARE